jgi:uncharacterized phage protein gp47/JayE
MTTYGLTETGPVRKPASQIRADIVTKTKVLPGLGQVRTTPGSSLGNRIDPFVEELSQCWEAWEASVLAFDRDSATGKSLDNALALTGSARRLATYSTLALTLWTMGNAGVLVAEGNLVVQSETDTQFETLADATIPAATVTVEDMVVTAVAHQTGNTIRYTFEAVDLSSVTTSMLLIITGCSVYANNGAFPITSVNDGANWVQISNPNRSNSAGNEAGGGAGQITDGFVSVNAQAVDKGAITATAQSVNSIGSPVLGWDGVVNLADGTPGIDTENNTTFRRRGAAEISIAGGGTVAAVVEKLLLVSGVTYASGISIDDPSDPGYGYYFTVSGGADQDIWDCIGRYKSIGMTWGDETGTYTDPQGNDKPVSFSRATSVDIFVLIEGNKSAALYPSDGDDLIKAALVAYGATLDNGDEVIWLDVVTAVGNAAVPGMSGITVKIGLSDPPSASDDLTLAGAQVARFAAENIEIDLTAI